MPAMAIAVAAGGGDNGHLRALLDVVGLGVDLEPDHGLDGALHIIRGIGRARFIAASRPSLSAADPHVHTLEFKQKNGFYRPACTGTG